ncbi:hypothetical protein AYR46_16690 [Sphingobium yanoikuyae]|uniref:hypothetical protein n=1 Tax=Sphingobium yanoikuyae TaxID=13690 RepID=UPI0007A74858|nr:hypothetical protein [Sphingobium yanoikuyae]KZC77794.1 hypothetical protein AYR46_16690 [Sphingobium yanoikuyae]
MEKQRNSLSGRPDILLMIQEGLPDNIEADVRVHLDEPGLNFGVIRHPGGPYAGVELYLPTALALFAAAGFFNGVLQEAGKDAYVAFKDAALALWRRASGLTVTPVGTPGKVSPKQRFSLVYSITGEMVPGLNFKFLIQTEIDAETAEAGINAFVDLIRDLLNDRMAEADVRALLTYKPVSGIVLVTFDAASRKIIPVNGFERSA